MKNNDKWFDAMRSIAIVALIVAIGMVTTACRSDDGGDGDDSMTWTRVDGSFPYMYAMAWGNGRFVAGGSEWLDFDMLGYSPDGVTWTSVADAKSLFGDDYNYITAIAWGNNRFVAGTSNGKMAYSLNGTTWTAVQDSTFGDHGRVNAIAWGNGKFVAVGKGETDDGSETYKIAYSLNGETWIAVTSSSPLAPLLTIAYGGDKFVVGGEKGYVVYSTDGVTNWGWTSGSYFVGRPFGYDSVNAIAWGNGTFVAVGDDEKMAVSTDGVHWTPVSSPFRLRSDIKIIAWGNNKFVAGGVLEGEGSVRTGEMAYSSNGEKWTIITDTANTQFGAIAWGNGKFVAAALHPPAISYSTD